MTQAEVEVHPTTKVARDIVAILNLHRSLLTQAIAHGDSPGIPGGEAMTALGNVSNVEAWDNHHQATERHDRGFENYRRAYTSVEDEDPDDAWSAYQLIEFWSESWRRERGDDFERKATLASEANYVKHAVEWAWDNEIAFDDFATDMRRARLRLEDIVYDGKRVDRTRVVCDQPTCENPRRLIKLHAIYDPTGVLDSYKCPSCKGRFTEDEYQRAYAKMLRSEGAQMHVPLVEALATLKAWGRGERTVRRWLSPMQPRDRCTACGDVWPAQEFNVCPADVEGQECGGFFEQVWTGSREGIVGQGYCEVGTHRVMVYWPDLWTKHLATRQARMIA